MLKLLISVITSVVFVAAVLAILLLLNDLLFCACMTAAPDTLSVAFWRRRAGLDLLLILGASLVAGISAWVLRNASKRPTS
jgi:hypothetical protein